MILTDLGHRLEVRAQSALGLGRLEAVAYQRVSREGDWMVRTRRERTPRAVGDKAAAVEALQALMVPTARECLGCGVTVIDHEWCVGCR